MANNELKIPSHWRCKRLVDCTSNKNISYGIVQPGQYTDDGIGIIRVNNFDNGEINTSDVLKVSENIESKFEKTRLEGGEVLLTLVGSTGQSAVVPGELKGWNVARAVAVIRPSDEVTADWLNMCLQSENTKHFLDARANTTVQKTLNLKDVKDIPVPLPPDDERKKLEDIYISYKNKINLNRQINQTLEQMAQALFKSWFVDFDPVVDNALDAGFFEQDLDLPDELLRRAETRRVVRERGEFKQLPEATRRLFPAAFEECAEPSIGLGGWVPKGWNIKKIENLMELVYGKALKSTDRIDGPVPVYGSGGITGYHNESMVDGPSIIIGRKGTVGSLYWEDKPFFPIDTVFYVRSEKPITYCFYLLQTLGLADMNTDAAVPGLNRNNVYRLQATTPDDDLLNAFDTLVTTLRKRIFANKEQLTTLINLRDSLLPKLISGELSLDKMESVL
ncbi:restriction endonuclease subunit S [Aeromonas veronii]